MSILFLLNPLAFAFFDVAFFPWFNMKWYVHAKKDYYLLNAFLSLNGKEGDVPLAFKVTLRKDLLYIARMETSLHVIHHCC